MSKFKVGDKVLIRNDEHDEENQSKLGDLDADLLMDLADHNISGRAYDAIWNAIEKSWPFTVVAVVTERGDEPHYEVKMGKWNLGYMIAESQLEASP